MNRVNNYNNRPLIQPVQGKDRIPKLKEEGKQKNQSGYRGNQRDKKKNNEFSDILKGKLEEQGRFDKRI